MFDNHYIETTQPNKGTQQMSNQQTRIELKSVKHMASMSEETTIENEINTWVM